MIQRCTVETLCALHRSSFAGNFAADVQTLQTFDTLPLSHTSYML